MPRSALEKQYQFYLETGCVPSSAGSLVDCLLNAGLTFHAAALRAYLDGGSGAAFTIPNGIWQGRRCVAGPQLPRDVAIGDIWLDTVELQPMIGVAGIEDSAGPIWWLGLSPTAVWQFRVFLRLAKWHIPPDPFLLGSDLMDASRFAEMPSFSPVTDLYHEEAHAYACWHRKGVSSQRGLRYARQQLATHEFAQLMPDHLRLWEGPEYIDSESARIARNRSTLDASIMDLRNERDVVETTEGGYSVLNTLLPDRSVFGEWERRDDIGMSIESRLDITSEYPRGKYPYPELPAKAYEFVWLDNLAPQPTERN